MRVRVAGGLPGAPPWYNEGAFSAREVFSVDRQVKVTGLVIACLAIGALWLVPRLPDPQGDAAAQVAEERRAARKAFDAARVKAHETRTAALVEELCTDESFRAAAPMTLEFRPGEVFVEPLLWSQLQFGGRERFGWWTLHCALEGRPEEVQIRHARTGRTLAQYSDAQGFRSLE